MTIAEIYEAADRIGLLSFSTIHNGEVHSRIAHFNGYDDEGIYFRTMASKPYCRQLKESGKLTVCGNWGDGILNHEDVGAEPVFAPGYTFRMVCDVRYVAPEEIIRKAQTNKMLEVAARDIKNYPTMGEGNFMIYRAKGEIYDYDFAKINRDHKLLRTRFSFGGVAFNPAGVRINPDLCVSCGTCKSVCSFDAIEVVDEKYRVRPERCDDCGSCRLRCPVGAIEESLTM